MVSVHSRLGAALVVAALMGLLWSLFALRQGTAAFAALRAYARLALVAVTAQGGLGVALLLAGHRPAASLHFLYGPATLLAAAVSALGWRDQRRERLVRAVGMGAMLLLCIRALGTGG